MNAAFRPPVASCLTTTLAALCLASPAWAAELTLRLDPETTRIDFVLPATGHDVHGSFALRSGEVRFDPATGAAAGEIVIDATVARTGSASRDKKMHREVLESDKFPTFVFRAEHLEGALAQRGSSDLTLHGKLAIHGAEHPFALPAKVERQDGDLSARVQFEIPFVAWGMKDPSILFLTVDKEVAVTVEARGRIVDGAADGGARR